AVVAEDVLRIKALLAAGANVNESNLFGTPLHIAAARNSMDTATILIDAGANLEAEAASTQKHAHPLHIAASVNAAKVAGLWRRMPGPMTRAVMQPEWLTRSGSLTKLDRLGRNAMDVRTTVEALADMGVKVHCLALGGVDLTSPAG